MTRVSFLHSRDEWSALQSGWQSLLDATGNTSPFMTWEWLDAWQAAFAGGQEVVVIVAEHDGQVVAIVPFVASTRLRFRTAVRTLRLFGAGLSDRLGLLVRPGHEAVLEDIAAGLLSGELPWDVLELNDLPVADPIAEAFCRALRAAGIAAALDVAVQCPYVPVATDWESFYTQRFGKKTRTSNRQKRRKLGALGDLQFRWVDAAGEVETAIERIRAMDERGDYQGEDRIRPFDSPKGYGFFLDFCCRFAERGWLLIALVELDGQVIAYRFGFRFGNRHFDFFPGFSPEYFKLSVGRLLMVDVMQRCFEDRVDEVDLLRGFESWKSEWTETSRDNATLVARNPTLGSWLRVSVQRLLPD